MKNRLFNSILLALTCSVCFTACNKDEQFVDLNANIVNYGNNDSKVYVDDAHYANWHNEDAVMINGTVYSVAIDSDGQSRPYASIPNVAVNEDGFYAIYPCDRIITPSTTTPSTTTPSTPGFPSILMPQVQVYTQKDGKQIIKAPMAAYCAYNSSTRTGHYLNFKNLCSLIEVNVPTNTEVAYIQVTSSDKYLWGNASITGSNNPVLQIDESTTEDNYSTNNNYTVTLDCTTNGSNGSNTGGAAAHGKTGGPFYVVVPAGTYTNLTVDVYIFDGTNGNRNVVKLYTKTANATNNSATINNNMIYSVVCEGEPSDDEVQPPYPGLGTGEFSVSPTKKVRFSQGNLQYKNGVWRFATDELESFRNASNHNLVTTNRDQNWIDLFGFGTSGQGSLSTSRTPNLPTTYTYVTDYYPHENLTGTNRYDWGVNEICNGGNQPDRWRTLTKEEWQYLLGNSTTNPTIRNNKNVLAVIDGNTGLVIAPDDCSLASGWNSTTTVLRITQQQYISIYQRAGCVFLPVTGYYAQANDGVLNMYDCSNSTPVGWYWTSTYEQPKPWAAKVVCSTNGGGVQFAGQEIVVYQGCAVRLVRDVD